MGEWMGDGRLAVADWHEVLPEFGMVSRLGEGAQFG